MQLTRSPSNTVLLSMMGRACVLLVLLLTCGLTTVSGVAGAALRERSRSGTHSDTHDSRGTDVTDESMVASESRVRVSSSHRESTTDNTDGVDLIWKGLLSENHLFRRMDSLMSDLLGIVTDRSSSSSHSASDMWPNLEDYRASMPGFKHQLELPPFLSNALDVAAQAVQRNAEFAYSADGQHLMVTLNVTNTVSQDERSSKRKLTVAVGGHGGHLDVKLETESKDAAMLVEHMIPLPVRVLPEGIESTVREDGIVELQLDVVGDRLSLAQAAGRTAHDVGMSLADLFFGDPTHSLERDGRSQPESNHEEDNADESVEVVRVLPSQKQVDECRTRHEESGLFLLARKCVCDAERTSHDNAMCLTHLLRDAVDAARRLGMVTAANNFNHDAIECTDAGVAQARCLESVAQRTLARIYSMPELELSHKGTARLSNWQRQTLDEYAQRVEANSHVPTAPLVVTAFAISIMALIALAGTKPRPHGRALARTESGHAKLKRDRCVTKQA